MWLTSNTPTALRTALCSSMMPEYCTGISQPPKSTILAPNARWTEFKGVVRRAGSDGMKIQANTPEWRVNARVPSVRHRVQDVVDAQAERESGILLGVLRRVGPFPRVADIHIEADR